jgi:hypothetical protein
MRSRVLKIAALLCSLATIAVGKGSVTGKAIVALDAAAPCVAYRGLEETATVADCRHDACTRAKDAAAAALRARIPVGCHGYVRKSGRPCRSHQCS